MENIIVALIGSCIPLIGVLATNKSNKNKIASDIDKKNTELINQVKLDNIQMINKVKEENTKVVNEIKTEMKVNQTKTDMVIEELTREVREHNNFAKRMPVVEEGIENLKEKVNYFHKI